MSTAVLHSRALIGVDAPEVAVEIHLANGLPAFSLVGLPETEVKEARERVRAALLTTGYDFPNRRVTVNLAPADLPKASGRFDLPIALGILAASGQLPAAALDGHEFAGELGLTGELRPIRGALVMACAARRAGRIFVLPAGSADEAAIAGDGLALIAADTLATLTAHFDGRAPLAPFQPAMAGAGQPDYPDLGDVRGQGAARRALEIAAAGTHSLLLCGPPGTGKSMLAARLPGILPPMHHDEALATAAVHALVQPFDPARFHCRPYRTPHHSSSAVALVGGGVRTENICKCTMQNENIAHYLLVKAGNGAVHSQAFGATPRSVASRWHWSSRS
ncbi:YifB family Mg chelatase-like AAA ATPase [Microvirgula aerodenitrificans]|uniref:YifB family Mg chelatase-like AAA ATPase n=1 Tax=Microvirgula aerodenitrificans TaxID=57480 RepID=UPI0006867D70|nr:magnesium chelatase domain-containing protein [Microvirgula aerodenitrificans]